LEITLISNVSLALSSRSLPKFHSLSAAISVKLYYVRRLLRYVNKNGSNAKVTHLRNRVYPTVIEHIGGREFHEISTSAWKREHNACYFIPGTTFDLDGDDACGALNNTRMILKIHYVLATRRN